MFQMDTDSRLKYMQIRILILKLMDKYSFPKLRAKHWNTIENGHSCYMGNINQFGTLL